MLFSIVGIIAASAVYVSNYEKNQLEKCKKEAEGMIIDTAEKTDGSVYVKFKYTVGSTEYIASETIADSGELSFLYLGQNIDVFYSCTNPKVSRTKKANE